MLTTLSIRILPLDVTQIPCSRALVLILVWLLIGLVGCTQPLPPPVPVPVTPVLVTPTLDEKMSWILRLEDQRVLRDPVSTTVQEAASENVFPSVEHIRSEPDLVELLSDVSARLRRRAALAIGRIGDSEGVPPLVRSLADPEPEVREMVAFALGLIGEVSAADALELALRDPSPLVQGRAAEALGRIGASDKTEAIGVLVDQYVTSAFNVEPEDVSYPLTPEVEAFRLGLYALAELKAYEPLAGAILQDDGQPLLWWWPVAYALSRLDDERTLQALTALAGVQGIVGVSMAVQGLGELGNPAAIETLVELLDLERRDRRVVSASLRALARFEDEASTEALRFFVLRRNLDPTLRLEAVEALRGRRDADTVDIFVELITDSWAPMRAAALRALAEADRETFILVLSGLDIDSDWRVRVALAQGLVHIEPKLATFRLMSMLLDDDQRVLPAVISSLFELGAPGVRSILLEHLSVKDPVVRKMAAHLLSSLTPPPVEELKAAYHAAADEMPYLARAAILDSLAQIGGPVAVGVLRAALTDHDWAVRVRAAQLLDQVAPGKDHASQMRPAPLSDLDYTAPHLVDPSVSTHVYIETERGTIQLELAVLDAPLIADNFVKLARSGYYDGLVFHRVVTNFIVQGGDPRGDSEGGPGYTLRDEINQLPFLRGTLGLALDWEDTGGSQFFITQSPQPQLDGKYTVFGRVVDGMEVVDQLRLGDLIERVLVWDGVQPLLR